MDVSKQFIDMVDEIVKASKLEISVANYLQDSLLRTLSIGANHEDRLRTIDFLVQTGCLQIRDDRFLLVKTSAPEWVIQAAAKGFEKAFNLAPEFIPHSEWKEKFDYSVLKEIGLRGELAFVEHLRLNQGPDDEIKHVSLFDDSLGYDVLHEIAGRPASMYEVKTTSRPNKGYFEFFLSRNEFETSKKAGNWKVACMRISEGNASFEGFVDWEYLKENFPVDQNGQITWSIAKVIVEATNLMIDFDGPTLQKPPTVQLKD
jgi:hypothetical protein